ncbi:MAG: glycosyltransferase family 2 protein [Deltaproteobacteria bacterium]|nr:glycosyltransferase family 2 protein [Deltaproteobacteria bacterium]
MSTLSVSVLVASVAGDGSLSALLASLRAQVDHEVVVADRTGGGDGPKEGVAWVDAPPETSIPALRSLALSHATGDLVVVVEDHCIAPPGWLERLVAPLRSHPDAVLSAGPVRDVLDGSPTDRAAFLCDYAPFLPGGLLAPPPGMNTAYRATALREALDSIDGETFWEGPVHRRLARRGTLARADDAVLGHSKAFPMPLGVEQRYLQGRHFGAWRTQGLPARARTVVAGASLGMAPLLTARTLRAGLRGGASDVVGLTPLVALLHLAGTVGEAVGALLGGGDALGRIV